MLKGYLNYYAASGNGPSLWWYFNEVRRRSLKSLKRRGQCAFLSWEKFARAKEGDREGQRANPGQARYVERRPVGASSLRGACATKAGHQR